MFEHLPSSLVVPVSQMHLCPCAVYVRGLINVLVVQLSRCLVIDQVRVVQVVVVSLVELGEGDPELRRLAKGLLGVHRRNGFSESFDC